MKTSLFLTLLASPLLSAGEFNPENIPAGAQWYLHADAEQLRETKIGKTIIRELRKNHGQQLADVENLLDFDPIKDLSDVSLFGNGKKDSAVIIIQGNLKRSHLESVIVDADKYQSNDYQGETIHSWRDKGKNQNAAFHGPTLVVVSENVNLVMETLDVLAKRKPHLIVGTDSNNGSVMMGTANIEALNLPADKGSKLVKKAQAVNASLSEVEGRLRADVVITTKKDITASRLQKIAEGLIAFGMMSEPDLEELNIEHSTSAEGNKVSLHLSLPTEEALAILKEF